MHTGLRLPQTAPKRNISRQQLLSFLDRLRKVWGIDSLIATSIFWYYSHASQIWGCTNFISSVQPTSSSYDKVTACLSGTWTDRASTSSGTSSFATYLLAAWQLPQQLSIETYDSPVKPYRITSSYENNLSGNWALTLDHSWWRQTWNISGGK